MVGISLKQFQRTYPGNYKLNFPLSLSESKDFKTKNYTNFYLSGEYRFSDIFDIDSKRIRGIKILTPFKYGSDLLKFNLANPKNYSTVDRFNDHFNYGVCSFTSVKDLNTQFTLNILENNVCNIFHTTKDYKKYYLVSDINNKLSFVKENLLNFDSRYTNPQDFKYLFSEDQTVIQLFKETNDGQFFITKNGNDLEMFQIFDDNVVTYVSKSPFKIERNIYTYPNINLDTSFISYTNDNSIDAGRSIFNLKNNYLLHKKYINNRSIVDIIPLKNQLLNNDVFSSSNNLLSCVDDTLFVDGLRDYTSISQDIKEETSDELEINYVFYNQAYKIESGSNYFISPSSMYPFSKLNINDSKFVDSGSFSFDTPQYADKVYELSKDPKNLNAGQYLLCTWLSGAPTSKNKVWVDRYYYPDRIEKEAALLGKPAYETTYDDYIELLIQNNSSIKNSVDSKKFFDKKSDLAFEPNTNYLYERVGVSSLNSLSSTVNYCNNYIQKYPSNYFKQINNTNKFTFGFYFVAGGESWVVKSDHNAITCGLTISKNNQNITINYTLYDPVDGSSLVFVKSSLIKPLKENFVCVSVDAIKGEGYFFLNNQIIHTFKIPIFQYVKKQLLYGDFYVFSGSEKIDILVYDNLDITTPFISDQYTEPNLTFTLPILNGKMKIDDIFVTLPCGLRNSIDNIEYLQSVCGSSAFKSNNINVRLKNLNILNENILNGLKDSITSGVTDMIPVNININNIEFDNFK